MKIIEKLIFIILIAVTSNLTAQTVYTTKTGEKYHTSTCRYLKYSKKEILLVKALELKFSACSVCKPSTKVETSQNTTNLSSSTISSSSKTTSTTSQCNGKTQSGARCKRMTKNTNGRCYQHQ